MTLELDLGWSPNSATHKFFDFGEKMLTYSELCFCPLCMGMIRLSLRVSVQWWTNAGESKECRQ